MSQGSFWDNSSNANKLVAELKSLKTKIEPFNNCEKKFLELKELSEISSSEEPDLLSQISQDLDKLEEELSNHFHSRTQYKQAYFRRLQPG